MKSKDLVSAKKHKWSCIDFDDDDDERFTDAKDDQQLANHDRGGGLLRLTDFILSVFSLFFSFSLTGNHQRPPQ